MSTIAIGRTATGYLVRIGHHGTLRESRLVSEFLASLRGPAEVDVDLSGTAYLDSTFMGCLMGHHKRLNLGRQGRFRICGPVENLRRLMGKTRLDTVLPMVETVPSLVGSEQELSAEAMDAGNLADFIADAHRKLAELGGPDSDAYARVADRLEEESRSHARRTHPG